MKKIIKNLFNGQQGNALVLVAFFMVVLLGVTALAIDGGRLYFSKSTLQKSLDAAVLAGAQEILSDEEKAKKIAKDIASKNGISLDLNEIKVGANYIEIGKKINKDLTFGRILGLNNSDIYAISRAEIRGSLVKKDGIVPVGIEKKDFKKGTSYSLNFQTNNSTSKEDDIVDSTNPDDDYENTSIKGNFGFLDIDDSENKNLEEDIKYGVEMELSEHMEKTKTGFTWGQVRKGFQYRIDQDKLIDKCQSSDTADADCTRVILLPIVEDYSKVAGKSEVKIVGFAAFWIDYIKPNGKKKAVYGKFIELITFGEFEESEDDYDVHHVRLVK